MKFSKDKLKSLMKGRDRSKFARFIGVSRSTLYQWMSGRSQPVAGNLMSLAKGLGVSTKQLMEE